MLQPRLILRRKAQKDNRDFDQDYRLPTFAMYVDFCRRHYLAFSTFMHIDFQHHDLREEQILYKIIPNCWSFYLNQH